MKIKSIAILCCAIGVNVLTPIRGLARDYVLDSKEVVIHESGDVRLIRTDKTPRKVKILKTYKLLDQYCEEEKSVQQCGFNLLECGFHTSNYHYWYYYPHAGRYPYRLSRRDYFQVNPYHHPQYCCWSETVCVSRDYVETEKSDWIKIDFGKAMSLSNGLLESYILLEGSPGTTKPKWQLIYDGVRDLGNAEQDDKFNEVANQVEIKRNHEFIGLGKLNFKVTYKE